MESPASVQNDTANTSSGSKVRLVNSLNGRDHVERDVTIGIVSGAGVSVSPKCMRTDYLTRRKNANFACGSSSYP